MEYKDEEIERLCGEIDALTEQNKKLGDMIHAKSNRIAELNHVLKKIVARYDPHSDQSLYMASVADGALKELKP